MLLNSPHIGLDGVVQFLVTLLQVLNACSHILFRASGLQPAQPGAPVPMTPWLPWPMPQVQPPVADRAAAEPDLPAAGRPAVAGPPDPGSGPADRGLLDALGPFIGSIKLLTYRFAGLTAFLPLRFLLAFGFTFGTALCAFSNSAFCATGRRGSTARTLIGAGSGSTFRFRGQKQG